MKATFHAGNGNRIIVHRAISPMITPTGEQLLPVYRIKTETDNGKVYPFAVSLDRLEQVSEYVNDLLFEHRKR